MAIRTFGPNRDSSILNWTSQLMHPSEHSSSLSSFHASFEENETNFSSIVSQVSSLTGSFFPDESRLGKDPLLDSFQERGTASQNSHGSQNHELIRNVQILLSAYRRLEYEKEHSDVEKKFLLEERTKMQNAIDIMKDQAFQRDLEISEQSEKFQKEMNHITLELEEMKRTHKETRESFEKERALLHKSLQEQQSCTDKWKSKVVKMKKQKQKLIALVERQQDLLDDIYNGPPQQHRRAPPTISGQNSCKSTNSSLGTVTTSSSSNEKPTKSTTKGESWVDNSSRGRSREAKSRLPSKKSYFEPTKFPEEHVPHYSSKSPCRPIGQLRDALPPSQRCSKRT